MTTADQKPRRKGWIRLNKAQRGYLFKILLFLAALGVTIWVYGGDVYVALALAIFAGGIFAYGIAPGLIPPLIWILVRLPFYLGFLIPLWQAGDALLRLAWRDLLGVVVMAVLYGLAFLTLVRLPRRMRGPFLRWLPEGAQTPRQQPARAQADRPAREPRRGFGWRRGRKESPAAAEAGASVSPFTTYGMDRERQAVERESAASSQPAWRRDRAAGQTTAQPAASRQGFNPRREQPAPARGGREPVTSVFYRQDYDSTVDDLDGDEAFAGDEAGRERAKVDPFYRFGEERASGQPEKPAAEASAPKKGGLLGRRRGKAESKPAPEKRGGLFGRRGKAEQKPAAKSQPASGGAFYMDDDEDDVEQEAPKKGGLLGRRRGKAESKPAPEKRGGLFGRRGKAEPESTPAASPEPDERSGVVRHRPESQKPATVSQPASANPFTSSAFLDDDDDDDDSSTAAYNPFAAPGGPTSADGTPIDKEELLRRREERLARIAELRARLEKKKSEKQ